eukprot:1305572-Rhodomonas_salina.3
MSGTNIAYAAAMICTTQYQHSASLRAVRCYAVSGTELAFAIRCPVSFDLSVVLENAGGQCRAGIAYACLSASASAGTEIAKARPSPYVM